MRSKLAAYLAIASVLSLSVLVCAQEAAEPKPEPKKYLTPSERLKQAKTVYVRNAGGNDLPFNVIEGAIESWGRYLPADSAEKADLIIEVLAPEDPSGPTVTSKVSSDDGRPHTTTTSSRTLSSVSSIKMTVLDAHSKLPLWTATEKPKNAWREKAREENLIESARKLVTAFRIRVEPETAQPESNTK